MHTYLASSGAKVIKAATSMGTIVQVESGIFLSIVGRLDKPMVVTSYSKGLFEGAQYQYIVCYKGITFYTDIKESLLLPESIELIESARMFTPKFY